VRRGRHATEGDDAPRQTRDAIVGLPPQSDSDGSAGPEPYEPAGGRIPVTAQSPAVAAERIRGTGALRPVTAKIPGGRAHLYAPPTHSFVGSFEQAGFGLRYGALIFDFLIMLIGMMSFTFMITALEHRSVVGSNKDLLIVAGLTLLLFLLNFVVLAGSNGQTVGMRILGVRIIRIDGRPFSMGRAVLRHLAGYPLSMFFFFLGFLWILWDPRQQGWHDKLARTVVVMSR
jgi:uncharacterized RDD family membrane protein YckC